jgi:hypothetical protein
VKEEQPNLEKLFLETLEKPSTPTSFGDRAVELTLARLGLAVIRLDRSSSELARVNIRLAKTYTWLMAALFVIGIIQIALMMRGH